MHIIPIVILIASSMSALRWLSPRVVGETRLTRRSVVVVIVEFAVGTLVGVMAGVGSFPVFMRSAGGPETNFGVESMVGLPVSLSGVGGGVTYIVRGGRGTAAGFACESGLVARLGGGFGLSLGLNPLSGDSTGSLSGFLAGMPFAIATGLFLSAAAACC